MSQLAQARRMVAKSRRRVWRLARRLYSMPTRRLILSSPGDNDVAAWLIHDRIPARARGRDRAAAVRLSEEFGRRRRRLFILEALASERAWQSIKESTR